MSSQINWIEAEEMIVINSDAKPWAIKSGREHLYGVKTSHGVWIIEPSYLNRNHAIADYFNTFLGGEENLPAI